MSTSDVSRESVKGLAEVLGLKLDVQRLDELARDLRRSTDAVRRLDLPGLDAAEPAIIFSAREG